LKERGMAHDYDLIVIGTGGAGLSAAVTAAEAGCSVLIAEAEEKIGGSTGLSQGVFTAAGTSVQKALGYEDTADSFFDYYMTLNHWKLPAAVVRSFCDNAAPTLEWLISLGVEYPIKMARKPKGAVWPSACEEPGLYASGVEYPPRGHMPVGNGFAYIQALDQRRGALGVELVLKTRVQKLLAENGRVTGIEVDGQPILSRAVAVTVGGFGHDRDLIRKWFPHAYEGIPEGAHPFTIAAPGSRGDGIRLGEQVGAWITGKNWGLLNTRPWIIRRPGMPPALGTQPTSLVYVNREGHRFTDETAPYAVMPTLIKSQGEVAWGIFDEATRTAPKPTGNTATTWGSSWQADFILERVKMGDFQVGDTLEELAAKCGITNPRALKKTIANYNEDIPRGVDREFLRDLKDVKPISKPPFYAFQYRACDVNLTGAGMRIDAEAHVLDPDGNILPGLFAAGEAGAGVLGERYVGGGNSVANALTMGRVAGRTAARELGKRA